ncbi:transcriptional regulator [Pilimelia anulata]|uniref:Transcriptional regulator n=1 Tax=Pilimelia anulata TaxID=53371 RepID=A0A8J3F972_9ACTN|nr:helix-turn-helix transcriptional regulator [Pilimelia anulata]GGJ84213.1 transcriptional regulator [Pilimelia anulata]
MSERGADDLLLRPDGLPARLREHRKRAGLTGEQLAAAAGWAAHSKVSRIENGRQLPSDADLAAWAGVCGLDAAATAELRALLAGTRSARHSWRMRLRAGAAGVQAGYNELVASSTNIAHFETAFVPGLLQTRAYIRRALGGLGGPRRRDPADVEAAVRVRVARQDCLYDEAKRFEFLLAEPVLRWLVCEPGHLAAQLDRLQVMLDAPNVRLGILPLRPAAPLPIGAVNAFQLYDDVAIVETYVGETVHDEDDAREYRAVLAALWEHAVEGEAARVLIVEAAAALRR